MKTKYIIPIICVALLSCETTEEYKNNIKADLTSMTDAEVIKECIQPSYLSLHQEIALDEIVKRNLMDNVSAEYIKAEKIFIGMPEEAVRCSLGWPTKVNTTASAGGMQYQWVYECVHGTGDFSYYLPCKYVHIKNGKVTSYRFLDN